MKIEIIDFPEVNESFPGMSGGGYSPTFMPTYGVQGSNDTYSYSIHTFNDSLQQKPNEADDSFYIHNGDVVRGVGYNNPKKHFTGIVSRIVKDGSGAVIALYIKTLKTNTFVKIKADKSLELKRVRPERQSQEFNMVPSHNMSVNR